MRRFRQHFSETEIVDNLLIKSKLLNILKKNCLQISI